MTSFVYKALTRYLEYGNTRLWIFPYNWALRWASNRQFSANISNKKLLNAVKVHGYSFYHFWVIKGKRTVGYNYSPTRTSELINFREGEAKNSKGQFFILDLLERSRLTGMHLKFKTSVWSKDSFILELALKYIWSKTKYKPHKSIWERIKRAKSKNKRSVSTFQLLFFLGYMFSKPGFATRLNS